MAWSPYMTNLRNTLAGLYWNVEESRRVLRDVGFSDMQLINIAFSNKPINTWHHILEYSQNYGGKALVLDIAHQAQQEFPKQPTLETAIKELETEQVLMVETPVLDTTEWRGPTEAGQLERIIGTESTLRPINFFEKGLRMAKSVGKIVLADGSSGTGLLIANNVLLTNNHVLPSIAEARSAKVQFNYQLTVDDRNAPIDEYGFKVDAVDDFVTSPETGGDDWTAVRLTGDANTKWGSLTLARAEPKEGDRATIIQHPGGEQKQIAFYNNIVVAVTPTRIQYLTDTLGGSSGSPVFNEQWQVIALHHKGDLYEPRSKVSRWRNQGVHINVVIDSLKAKGIIV
jgi:V8-like Glu-specific endopeptidase